jgi:hypothetical protein
MRLPRGCTIERLPLFEAYGDFPIAAELNDFLHAGASGAFRDQYTVNGAAGLQGLTNGMDPYQNAHDLDVTVIEFSDFCRVTKWRPS